MQWNEKKPYIRNFHPQDKQVDKIYEPIRQAILGRKSKNQFDKITEEAEESRFPREKLKLFVQKNSLIRNKPFQKLNQKQIYYPKINQNVFDYLQRNRPKDQVIVYGIVNQNVYSRNYSKNQQQKFPYKALHGKKSCCFRQKYQEAKQFKQNEQPFINPLNFLDEPFNKLLNLLPFVCKHTSQTDNQKKFQISQN